MALEITDATFDEHVLNSDIPAMIDLWAPWCGPCKTLSPIVDELAREYEGKVLIGKVNVDESSEIPGRYAVRNIPTLLFFKKGELVDKVVGVLASHQLKEKLDQLI